MTDNPDAAHDEKTASYPWDVMLRDVENGDHRPNTFDFLTDDDVDRMMGLDSTDDGRSGKAAIAESLPESSGFSQSFRLFVDSLADSLTRDIRQRVAGVVQVAPLDASTIRMGTVLSSVPVPSLIAVIQSPELSGSGLIIIETALAYAYFDMVLGGAEAPSSPIIQQRPFSGLEIKLFQKLADSMCRSLGTAIVELVKASFTVDRIETTPRSIRVGAALDQCIRIRVHVSLGRRSGMLSFVFPVATFASLSAKIWLDESSGSEPKEDADWLRCLVQSIAQAQLPLDVMLAKFELPFKTVMAFAPGYTIPLEMKPLSPVLLRSGGHVLASGVMGRSHDRVAIRLQSHLSRKGEGELK
jgi:flagellar motor switch protein FliM